MGLDREAELLEQLFRARRVRSAVAGRVVARDLDQLGKERGLARKIALDEGGDLVGKRCHLDALFARRSPCNARHARLSSCAGGVKTSGPIPKFVSIRGRVQIRASESKDH
jgi:hypothetical protein